MDSITVPCNAPNENPDFTIPEMGPENSASKVTCRVCQEIIDVVGKRNQHVIKCIRCNEATVGLFFNRFTKHFYLAFRNH